MYNPTLNEAEWVPACSLANDLSWAKERSAVALANYVPCTSVEVAWITRLGAGRVVSCPGDDSSTSVEEEEAQHSDAPSTDTVRVRWGMRAKKKQMRQKQTHALTYAGTFKTGRLLWKSQKG